MLAADDVDRTTRKTWITTLLAHASQAEPAAIPSGVAQRFPSAWRRSRHQLGPDRALTGSITHDDQGGRDADHHAAGVLEAG